MRGNHSSNEGWPAMLLGGSAIGLVEAERWFGASVICSLQVRHRHSPASLCCSMASSANYIGVGGWFVAKSVCADEKETVLTMTGWQGAVARNTRTVMMGKIGPILMGDVEVLGRTFRWHSLQKKTALRLTVGGYDTTGAVMQKAQTQLFVLLLSSNQAVAFPMKVPLTNRAGEKDRINLVVVVVSSPHQSPRCGV